mgnify:CR=1 FL=1
MQMAYQRPPQEGEQEVFRVRLPRGKETLGILEQRLGGSRMRVRCMDGKTRICRVPGRLKKKLWVREGDVLLIEPWELGGHEKGDVLYKYKTNQVDWLKKNGHLKELEEFEEF